MNFTSLQTNVPLPLQKPNKNVIIDTLAPNGSNFSVVMKICHYVY